MAGACSSPALGEYPPYPDDAPEPTCPMSQLAPRPGVDYRGVDPNSANPLVGQSWLVEGYEPALGETFRLAEAGQTELAARMWRIASVPRFKWIGRWYRETPWEDKVTQYFKRSQCCSRHDGHRQCPNPGGVPLLALMRHQGKECRPDYRAGGPEEDERTRAPGTAGSPPRPGPTGW